MKIGYFTSIEGWGGSETHILALMKGIRAIGHVPVLFGIEGTRLIREAREQGVECVAWKRKCGLEASDTGEGADRLSGRVLLQDSMSGDGVKRRLLRYLPHGLKLLAGNVRDVMTLKRVFSQSRVDVMHVSVNGYELAGLACRLCRIPSIGWHCIMPGRDPSAIRRWLIKWTCWSYSIIGGTSRACINAWRELSGMPVRRCKMVWNGVDVNKFSVHRNSTRRPGEPFRILAVGRLHPMKGFDVLIKSVAVLDKMSVRLIIAGEGAEEKALRTLVHEMGCSDVIIFAGQREDVDVLYREADCFILPSVSHESFGLVLAEAMATGLPVITSDFGPLPEINVHGETGLVVPVGDVQALADAIQNLMSNPDLCVRFGVAGARRARDCFSLNRMVAEMNELYQSQIV